MMIDEKEIRYFSMFTGAGGFELGIENAGSESNLQRGWNKNLRSTQDLQQQRNNSSNKKFKCVGFSETDKFASELLKKRFPVIKNYGDATKIIPTELPDFNLLVGGFPCQAFSIAGKRKGFEDTRGTLFHEIVRILKVKRPEYLLLENVKGLLSHDRGRTFAIILASLSELGYVIQWMVLNSKFFGVPQNRERVFIIGSLRGTSIPEILPLGKNNQRDNEKQLSREETKEYEQSDKHIKDRGGHSLHSHSLYPRSGNPEQGGTGHLTKNDGTSYALDTGNMQGIEMIGSTQEHSTKMKDISPALTEAMGKGGGHVPMKKENLSIRRLTPIECERLQGFPQYESYINIKVHNNVCQLDLQKSYVNVESQNLKLLNVVGNVESEDINRLVQSVEKDLKQETNKPVQKSVLINCVEERIEISNQEKLLEYVNYVQNQDSFLQHIKKEDFAQMIVGINSICEKIITFGKEELLQNEQLLIHQKNGKIFVKLSGKEMMQLVKDVKKDSTILKEHLKYITSNPLNIENLDSKLITSFFYVISAIIGCIQKEIEIGNSLKLDIKSRFGYTYGFSDTQRYKMMGNAVTVNVVKAIIEKLK